MAPKKGVSTSLAEVKPRKSACPECRRRKKRCRHRLDPSASEAIVPPAVAADTANAANVPDAPAAAAQVDPPIDDNTAATILMTMRYGSGWTLEGDQGHINILPASDPEFSDTAPQNPADIPSRRSQTRLRISAPRRPSRPPVVDSATRMALNTSFSRQMAKKLADFEAKYQASMATHQAVMDAGKAIKDLSDWWLDTWHAQH